MIEGMSFLYDRKKAVLSIDDEPGFTDMLKRYLQPRGYDVDAAVNGTRGLEMARNKEYDVALLDLKMEGMHGDEIMREIKKISPGTKIIFITAYSDSGKTKSRLMREGAFAFIEKPISSLKELEKTMKKAVEPSIREGVGSMLKILIVDDEIDICDFVKNFFKERNFEVFIAHDGRQAVSVFEARKPEIVLLDLKMPGMDGMETLKEMKKTGNACKVIMVTAVDDKENIDTAMKLGVYDYITKPLLLEQLERTVLTAAEQIRVQEQSIA